MASDSGDRTQAATLRQAICAGWLHEWNRTMASRQSHVQRQRHQQCELPAAVRESDLGLSADEALMGWLDRARRAMQGPAVLTVLGSNPASEELWWADTEPHDRAALQLQRKANETDTFQWPFAAATSSSVNSHPLESQSSPEEAEQLLLCLHREWIDMSNTVLSPSIGAEALSASSRANNDPMAADHDLWANALTYLLNSRAHATPVISSSLLAWWLSSVDADLQKSDGFNAHQWYDCLCELQDAHEASAGAASVGVESDASVPTSESTAKGDADVSIVDSAETTRLYAEWVQHALSSFLLWLRAGIAQRWMDEWRAYAVDVPFDRENREVTMSGRGRELAGSRHDDCSEANYMPAFVDQDVDTGILLERWRSSTNRVFHSVDWTERASTVSIRFTPCIRSLSDTLKEVGDRGALSNYLLSAWKLTSQDTVFPSGDAEVRCWTQQEHHRPSSSAAGRGAVEIERSTHLADSIQWPPLSLSKTRKPEEPVEGVEESIAAVTRLLNAWGRCESMEPEGQLIAYGGSQEKRDSVDSDSYDLWMNTLKWVSGDSAPSWKSTSLSAFAWWLSSVRPSLATECGFFVDKWEEYLRAERRRVLDQEKKQAGMLSNGCALAPIALSRIDFDPEETVVQYAEWAEVAQRAHLLWLRAEICRQWLAEWTKTVDAFPARKRRTHISKGEPLNALEGHGADTCVHADALVLRWKECMVAPCERLCEELQVADDGKQIVGDGDVHFLMLPEDKVLSSDQLVSLWQETRALSLFCASSPLSWPARVAQSAWSEIPQDAVAHGQGFVRHLGRAAAELEQNASIADRIQWPLSGTPGLKGVPLGEAVNEQRNGELVSRLLNEWKGCEEASAGTCRDLTFDDSEEPKVVSKLYDLWASTLTWMSNESAGATLESMLAWWLSSVSPSLARERGFRSDRWEQHVNVERIRYLAAGETGGGLNIASAKPSPVVHVRRDICTIHFDEWSKVACGAATDAEDAETARLVKEWTAMSWNSSVLAREVDMLQWLNHICSLTEDLQLHARAANSIATKRLHDEGMDLSRGPSIYRQWRNLDGNIETGLNAEIEGAAGDDKFSFEARIWLNDIDLLLNGCLLQKNGDWDPWPPAYTADVQGVLVRAAAIGIHENLSVREKEKEHLADFPQPSYDRWLHMDREAQRIALCNDELSRALYALWLDAMATSDTCPISHRVPREPAADACDSHFECEYIEWVDGVLEDLNAHTEAHVSGESMDPLVLEAHEKEPEELLAWRTLITMENGLRAEGGLERTRTESNFDLWIQTLQIDHNIHCPDPALQFQVLQREVSSPSPGASTRDAESILSAWRDAASEGSSPEGLSVVEHLNELAGDENASIVKDGKEEPYVKVVEEDDLVVGANGVSRPTSVPFEEVLKEVEELVDVMEFEAVFARTENVEPGARLEEEFASETHSSAGSNADTWSNLRGRSDETKNSGSDFQVSSSRAASFYDAEICQEFLIPTESDEQSEIEDQMAETLSLDESKEGEVAFRPEERRAIVLPGLAREMTEFLNLPVVEMELLSDMAAAEREEEIFTETISFSRDGEVTEVEESVVTKHEKSDHRSVGTVADHENHSEPARVQGRRVAKQFASIGIQTGTASMEDAEASSTLLERNKKPVESTKKQSSRLSTSSVHFSSSSPKNMSPRETELPPSSPKVAPVSHRQKKVKDMKVRDSHAVKKKAAKKSIARLEELDFSDLDDFDFKSGLRDFDADEHVVLSKSVASPRAQQKHEKRSKEPFHTLVSPPEAEESKRQAAAIESTQVRMRVLEETVTANWSPRPGKHKLTSPRADEIASRKATGTGFLASDNSPKAALMRQSTHSSQLQQKGSFGSDQPILEQDMRNAAFSRERVDTVMTTASEFDALGGLPASVSRTFEPPNGDSSIGLSDYVRVANEATFSSKDLHAARSTCRCLRYPFRLPERSVQNLIISQRYGKQLGKSHTQASRQPPPEDSDFSGMWGRQYIASSTILRAETSKEVQEVNTGSQMDTSKLSLKDKLNDEDHTHQMKKKKEASAFAEGKTDPQLDSVQRSLTRSKTQERYSSTSRSGTAIPNRSRTRKTGVEAAPVLVFSPRDAKGGERSVTDRAKQYQHSVSRTAPHSLISPRGKSILSPRSEPQELNHMTKQIPGPQHAVTYSDSVRSSAMSDFDSELYVRTYTKFTGRNETGRLLTHEEFSGASGASGPSIMRSSLLVPVGGRGMTAAGGGEFSSNLARGWSSCTVGGNLMPRQNRDLVSRPSCQSSTQLTNLADLDSDPVLVAVHFHRGEVVVLSRTSLVVYSSGGQQRILDILIEPQGSLIAGMMLQLEDELWAVSSTGTVYAVNTVRGSIRSVDLLSDADRANGVRVTSICFVGENSDIFLVGFSHGVASMASRLSFESHCQILPRAEHLTARVEHVASAWIEATPHVSTVCIGYSDGYVRCVRVENQGSNIAVSEMSTFLVSASSLLGLVLLFEGSVVVTLSAGQRGSMVSCFNSVDGSICGSETTSSKGFCLSTIDFLNRCTVCPSANMLLIGGSHGSVEVLRVSPVSSQRTVLKRSFKIQSHAIGGVAAGKSKQLRHASVNMKRMTLSTSRIAYDPVNQIIYALTMERQVLRWGISGPDAVLLATPNSCGTQRHMDVQLPMYPIDLLWNDFVVLRHITLEQETRLLDPIRDLQAQFAGLLERLSSPLFVLPDSVKLSDVGSMSFDRCLEEFDRLVARGFEGEKHVREKYEKIYPGRGSQTQQSHPSSLMSGLGDAAISLHRTRLELLSTYAQRSMAYEIYYVRESAITSIRDFEQRERLGLSSLLKHIVEDAKCSPKVRSETLAMVAQFSGTIQAP